MWKGMIGGSPLFERHNGAWSRKNLGVGSIFALLSADIDAELSLIVKEAERNDIKGADGDQLGAFARSFAARGAGVPSTVALGLQAVAACTTVAEAMTCMRDLEDPFEFALGCRIGADMRDPTLRVAEIGHGQLCGDNDLALAELAGEASVALDEVALARFEASVMSSMQKEASRLDVLSQYNRIKAETLISVSPVLGAYLEGHSLTGSFVVVDNPAFVLMFAKHVTDDLKGFLAHLTGRILLAWRDVRRAARALDLVERVPAVGEALERLWVKRHACQTSAASAAAVARVVLETFSSRLSSKSHWMDVQTRSAAVAKLDAVTVRVGGPTLQSEGRAPWDDSVDFCEAVFASDLEQRGLRRRSFSEPVNASAWLLPAYSATPYVAPSLLQIVVPHGALRRPFACSEFSDAKLFGGIGALVARCAATLVGDNGSKVNSRGSLSESKIFGCADELNARTDLIVYHVERLFGEGGRASAPRLVASVASLQVAYASLASLGRVGTSAARHFFCTFLHAHRGSGGSERPSPEACAVCAISMCPEAYAPLKLDPECPEWLEPRRRVQTW